MYRIMIVDDEPAVRKGLLNFIKWDNMDCCIVCESDNGIDARSKIAAFSPDIIISDIKMPGLNGIELSKHVYEKYPGIKVILLTGYSEFTFAQSAVKYGVVDFVLKPTTTEDIVDAVEKAKRIISRENEQKKKILTLESRINSNLSEAREKFFQDIINGSLTDPNIIADKLKVLDISLESYYTIVYEIDDFRNRDGNPSAEEINREEFNRFISSVRNLLSLSFKNNRHYNISLSCRLLCTVICFSNEESSECMQKILSACEEILDMISNFSDFTVSIGISSIHSGALQLPASYNEALKSLTYKFYSEGHTNEGHIFIYSDYLSNQAQMEERVIEDYIHKILEYLKAGNDNAAIHVLNELIKKQKSFRQPIDYVINIGILICLECSRLLLNHNMSITKIMQNSGSLYKQILQSSTMDSLYTILTEVVRSTSKFLSSLQRQNNYIIKKAMEYIKNNYTRNIRHQSIAEYVHVNKSYLSRLFHKETGETLTDAITRIRIEKAKELLANTNIKTYEVAFMVGIDDPAYFSVLFKKMTGLSPTEYKNSL